MAGSTRQLRSKLRRKRESNKRINSTRTSVFGAAAKMYSGRTFPNGLSGLHGAIQNDPRYKPNQATTRRMTPKQAAALRKAQAAAAIANRK